MIEREPRAGIREQVDADFVEFRATGEHAQGSFRCSDCGYGVVVADRLPPCPMCGGAVWEESPGSSFRGTPPL